MCNYFISIIAILDYVLVISQRRYIAPANQAGLRLKRVLSYNGNGRGNIIWHPDSGLFAYTCGSILVLEDLDTSAQTHLLGKEICKNKNKKIIIWGRGLLV